MIISLDKLSKDPATTLQDVQFGLHETSVLSERARHQLPREEIRDHGAVHASMTTMLNQRELEEKVLKLVDHMFATCEERIISQLLQVDRTFTSLVQEVRQRVSVCEVKLRDKPQEDFETSGRAQAEKELTSVMDLQSQMQLQLEELKKRVADIESKLSKLMQTEAESLKVLQTQAGQLEHLNVEPTGDSLPQRGFESLQAHGWVSHVPNLDLSAEVEDIQRWRAKVDDGIQINGREKVAAADDYAQAVGDSHVHIESSVSIEEAAGAADRQVSPREEEEHSFNQHLPVFLRPCVWDYAFLIGLPKNSLMGSLMVLLLMSFSVILQGFLCLAINDLFTVPIVSDNIVQEMHDWRLHVAHRVENMDVDKGVPLARIVCSLDVPTAGSASQYYDLIVTYLPTEEYYERQEPIIGPLLPYLYHIGVLLSAVACIIWCLRIVEDLDDICDIARAVNNLPVHELTEVEYSADSFKVLAVSRQRKTWYLSMLLLEVLLLSFLGFTGVAYIVNTLELTDLLLNCSALAIVFDIDIYVAHCMPKIFQRALGGMDPIVRPIRGRFRGAGTESCAKVATVFAISITATVVSLSGVQILEDARLAICGGNLDFLVAEDTSGVLNAIKTHADPIDRDVYIDHAMEQLLNHGDRYVQSPFGKEDMSAQAISMRGGPSSFQEWMEMGPEVSSAYWNPDCVDMLPLEGSPYSYSRHFQEILTDLHISDTPISHCSQVQQYCSQTTSEGERVRQVCPTTCGCDDPGYKLVWLPSEYACPDTCARSAAYNSSRWSRECEDLDVSSPVWSHFHDGMRSFFTLYGGTMDQSLANIKELGCQAISSPLPLKVWGRSWQDLCQAAPDVHFKSLTWACPVSCNCKEYDTQFCPTKCSGGASR